MTLTRWKTHHGEDSIELVVMVRRAGFDVLLLAVKDRFVGQQFRKDASNARGV